MKIEIEQDVIYGNNTNAPTQFKIASSSKAFKILSNNLYKHKIRAIVRELTCNAMDAHQLNGFTGKFDFLVPTTIDPRFVIRDYGPGLSDVDMNELYTTYFASTKNESNDFRGALGLGSKSPFSYTTTFTVVSYHDGFKTKFNAMLQNGEPALFLVSKKPSDEPSGIEVTVPVKLDDISNWHREIKYILRPFNPDNINLQGMELMIDHLPDVDVICNTERLSIFEQVSTTESFGIYANYGNIIYPIDINYSDETIQSKENYPWLCALCNKYIIKFDMGLLDIQPSREELSFDDITVENIKKRLSEIDQQIKDKVIEDIKEFTCPRKLRRYIQHLGSSMNDLIVAHTIENMTIPPLYTSDDLADLIELGHDGILRGVFNTHTPKRLNIRQGTKRANEIDPVDVMSYHKKRYIIVHMDKVVAVGNILDRLNEEFKLGQYEMFFIASKDADIDLVTNVFKRIAHSDEVIIIKSSKYWEPKKTAQANKLSIRPKVENVIRIRIQDGNNALQTEYLKLSAKEVSGLSGYYARLNRDEVTDPMDNKIIDLSRFHLAKFMMFTKCNELYLIRGTHVNYAVENDQMTNFFELLDKSVYDVDLDAIDSAYISNKVNNDYTARRLVNFFILNPTIDPSLLEEFVKNDLSKLYKIVIETSRYRDVRIKLDQLSEQYISDVQDYAKKFYKANPIIDKLVDNWNSLTELSTKQVKTIYDKVPL